MRRGGSHHCQLSWWASQVVFDVVVWVWDPRAMLETLPLFGWSTSPTSTLRPISRSRFYYSSIYSAIVFPHMGQQLCSSAPHGPTVPSAATNSSTLCYSSHSPPVSHWVFGCGDSRHCPSPGPEPGSLSPEPGLLSPPWVRVSTALGPWVMSLGALWVFSFFINPNNPSMLQSLYFPSWKWSLFPPTNWIGSSIIPNDIPFNNFNWTKYGLDVKFRSQGSRRLSQYRWFSQPLH